MADSITKEELEGLSAESGVTVVRPLKVRTPKTPVPVQRRTPKTPVPVKSDYSELVAAIKHQTETLSGLSSSENLTQVIDELRETNARLLAMVQKPQVVGKQPLKLTVHRDSRGFIESVTTSPAEEA